MKENKTCDRCSGRKISIHNYAKKYREMLGLNEGEYVDYQVHHIDVNRQNNCCKNLVLIPPHTHKSYHFMLTAASSCGSLDISFPIKDLSNKLHHEYRSRMISIREEQVAAAKKFIDEEISEDQLVEILSKSGREEFFYDQIESPLRKYGDKLQETHDFIMESKKWQDEIINSK